MRTHPQHKATARAHGRKLVQFRGHGNGRGSISRKAAVLGLRWLCGKAKWHSSCFGYVKRLLRFTMTVAFGRYTREAKGNGGGGHAPRSTAKRCTDDTLISSQANELKYNLKQQQQLLRVCVLVVHACEEF
ncbi:hypothetical protein GW17_00022386 [Ensete ventricosum]|nr:hypothetical protein GW17_00022386 [Ensete ventricosum]